VIKMGNKAYLCEMLGCDGRTVLLYVDNRIAFMPGMSGVVFAEYDVVDPKADIKAEGLEILLEFEYNYAIGTNFEGDIIVDDKVYKVDYDEEKITWVDKYETIAEAIKAAFF